MVDRAQSPPLEELAQLEHLVHRIERRVVAGVWHHALVLVLDLAAAFGQLFEHHPDRLQDVQRFESGDHQRLAVVTGDERVGRAADHHADVAGAEEAVERELRRVEDRLDRRDDGDVVAEHREVVDVLGLGAQHGERG